MKKLLILAMLLTASASTLIADDRPVIKVRNGSAQPITSITLFTTAGNKYDFPVVPVKPRESAFFRLAEGECSSTLWWSLEGDTGENRRGSWLNLPGCGNATWHIDAFGNLIIG